MTITFGKELKELSALFMVWALAVSAWHSHTFGADLLNVIDCHSPRKPEFPAVCAAVQELLQNIKLRNTVFIA